MISESLLNEWKQIDAKALEHAPSWVKDLYETEVKPLIKEEKKPACQQASTGCAYGK